MNGASDLVLHLSEQVQLLCDAWPILCTLILAAAVIYVCFPKAPGVVLDPASRIPVLVAIGTANPPESAGQDLFLDVCNSIGYDPKLQSLIEKIASRSGIDKRHTCVTTDGSRFTAVLDEPGARSCKWEEWAPKMAVAAARDALSRWPQGSAADITHVVVHSCTGFSAPGIDFHLIKELGLRSDTRKVGVNFMGCFGGFTSLYVAKQIIEADATGRAVVLIACSETCTVHMTRDKKVELIVGNAIFADGAGAAIVCHRGFAGKRRRSADAGGASQPAIEWAIGPMLSDIIPESAHCMTWKAGKVAGQYDMWLDKTIPSLLSSMFAKSGLSLLSKVGIASAWSCAWAIHPGGKAIITAFEEAFSILRIKGEGISASKEVLRNFGNMSSPTIFFVLQRVLASTARNEVFFAGFGPGLTIEYGKLYRVAGGGSPTDASDDASDGSSSGGERVDTPSSVSDSGREAT